jgi:mannose-6-phosphate isomerase-like protein (cupin superfamily)
VKGLRYVSLSGMANVQTRRNFLLTAPLAAAVASPLTDTLLRASTAGAAAGQAGGPAVFEVFPAAEMAGVMKDVQASHGTKDLVTSKATTMTMTVNEESKKAAKEFEYHAHRDHVFQVLDGETEYQLGGTPKNARETKPGEWLAPDSEGYTSVKLKKGDYLSIPRMTPHRRITDGSVTLLLIAARS